MSMRKKTILVTGANRGIGREICRQLDELGHQVILCSRDIEKGRQAAEGLSNNVVVKQLEVTSEADIIALYDDVKSAYGQLDVLINNAAVGVNHDGAASPAVSGARRVIQKRFWRLWKKVRRAAPILRRVGFTGSNKTVQNIPLEAVQQVMDINLYAPWRMIQVFAPLLKKSADGRVINISSGLGELKNLSGDYPAYSMSKAALNALTLMFSGELAAGGVTVVAMCPGWVKTDMGGPDAPREVPQGADTAVWLATEKTIETGKFYRDRTVINW